jgi:outer membrane protein insertion porin family
MHRTQNELFSRASNSVSARNVGIHGAGAQVRGDVEFSIPLEGASPFLASRARNAPCFLRGVLAAAMSASIFAGGVEAAPASLAAKPAPATARPAPSGRSDAVPSAPAAQLTRSQVTPAARTIISPGPRTLSRQSTLLAQAETNQPAADPEEGTHRIEAPPTGEVGPAPAPRPPAGTGTPGVGTPATPPLETPAQPLPVEPPVGSTAWAEGRQIANVRVVGSRVVPEDSILLQVQGTRSGAAFSSRQIELDRMKIDTLGFFASVSYQVTPNLEDPAKVDVAFVVIENRVVTGFRFEGNITVSDEDLQKVLETRVGSVLNRNTVNTDVEKVQALYRERGFAALVSETRQLEDGALLFVVQEAHVSKIEIVGLKKTRESLVRKQVLTKSGDTFDQTRIRRDLNRIYDMGFFEDVTYKISDDPDVPGSVIVTISVKEKRTGQLSLGLGFDSRSKVSGFGSITESNLKGTGKSVTIGAELGSRRTFELGLRDPFVGPRNASYDISVFDRVLFREPRAVEAITGNTSTFDYEEQRRGVRANYTYPLDQEREKAFLTGFRLERARLFQTNDEGDQQPVDLPQDASGTVAALSVGFLRDQRDLRLDPSNGGREQLILEQGFSALGGTSNFTKLDLDFRRYRPLIGPPKVNELPRLVLAGRVVAGRSFGQLPAFEQYFVGGPDTVRGYDVDEQFGDNQIFGNLELRYRLQRRFQLVAFADAGKAFGGPFASSASTGALLSVGGGVRVQTPIGPIRLDIGFGRDGARTHFAIGPTF